MDGNRASYTTKLGLQQRLQLAFCAPWYRLPLPHKAQMHGSGTLMKATDSLSLLWSCPLPSEAINSDGEHRSTGWIYVPFNYWPQLPQLPRKTVPPSKSSCITMAFCSGFVWETYLWTLLSRSLWIYSPIGSSVNGLAQGVQGNVLWPRQTFGTCRYTAYKIRLRCAVVSLKWIKAVQM